MCQYSAKEGIAQDWHLVHLGNLARGRPGLIFSEAAAVSPEGRITHGDLGIWSDMHRDALKPITSFIKRQGSVPGIQIGHAGRKASMQRPWFGNGPLNSADIQRGDRPWPILAPSAEAVGEGWITPEELTPNDITSVTNAFVEASHRAFQAGFEVLEIHAAHGYLLQTFLSPLSNHRGDEFGGDLARRMCFPLRVIERVREAWPSSRPLFVRISAVDGIDGGWSLDDSIVFAKEIKKRGVDVIDCSSGGNRGPATAGSRPPVLGFQVPFSARIRKDVDIATQAVGLIVTARQAEEILARGDADLIAIGRQALEDPFWPLRAAHELRLEDPYEAWPVQYGWWLARRAKSLKALEATSDDATD